MPKEYMGKIPTNGDDLLHMEPVPQIRDAHEELLRLFLELKCVEEYFKEWWCISGREAFEAFLRNFIERVYKNKGVITTGCSGEGRYKKKVVWGICDGEGTSKGKVTLNVRHKAGEPMKNWRVSMKL